MYRPFRTWLLPAFLAMLLSYCEKRSEQHSKPAAVESISDEEAYKIICEWKKSKEQNDQAIQILVSITASIGQPTYSEDVANGRKIYAWYTSGHRRLFVYADASGRVEDMCLVSTY
jgi:hypothetical protein